MTDATSAEPLKPELQTWIDAWKACTQNVLSQVSGQPNEFEVLTGPFTAGDNDLRYTIASSGAVQGEMALRLAQHSAIRLARKFLGETEAAPPAAGGAPAEITGDEREALEELLRQIAGLVATAVASAAGGEVQFQLTPAEAPWAGACDAIATLSTRDEVGNQVTIELRLSPALTTALAARAQAATAAESPKPAASPAAVSASDAAPDAHAAGYRRLLDVGLGVKLRFGTRRMLLRDVLALSSGLVVELDNPLNSPVELLLDGRIIARGEVVVVDGKYGLRVTDVLDHTPAPNTAV